MSKPVLFSYWRSSCSWRVRIALAFKDIAYEYRPVNLLESENVNNINIESAACWFYRLHLVQKQDWYNLINPVKRLPALVIGSTIVTESLAILEYLEESSPQPALLPDKSTDRAVVRALCQHIACSIQPIQNLPVLQYVGKEKSVQWAAHWIAKGFETLEQLLSSTAGLYCFGDSITFADCCLVPQVYNAHRFGVNMGDFPTIDRIDKALMKLPAFNVSHPRNQPDTPQEQKD